MSLEVHSPLKQHEGDSSLNHKLSLSLHHGFHITASHTEDWKGQP